MAPGRFANPGTVQLFTDASPAAQRGDRANPRPGDGGAPCRRSRAVAPLRQDARSGDPRGAGAAQPRLRQAARPALPRRQRVVRRPAPGRQPRPDQRDRPLRPRARDPLHRLRLADHPGRAETPLPRPGLDGAGAARPPRPDGRSRQSDHRADQGAAALALGGRDRRAARGRADRRARSARGQPQPAPTLARPARRHRRRRRGSPRRVGRRRGRGLRAGRGPDRARRRPALPGRARAAGAETALRRGHDAVADRRADRPLADARLAHPAPRPGPDPRADQGAAANRMTRYSPSPDWSTVRSSARASSEPPTSGTSSSLRMSSAAPGSIGPSRSSIAPSRSSSPSRTRPSLKREGAAAAIASVTRTASETRSIERSRRAARALTMRVSTGASSSGRSVTSSVVSPPRDSSETRSPRPSTPPPLSGSRIVTSVPWSSPPEIAKLLESAAISERPRRRLGWFGFTSACGRIPDPLSRTTTVRPSLSGIASTLSGPGSPG